MHRSASTLVLVAALLCLAPAAGAQTGLMPERAAGIGLKARTGLLAQPRAPAFGGEASAIWQATRASDFTLYGGSRPAPRVGLRASEAYGGIVGNLGRGWGSSIEAAYGQDSPLAPRRYALTGQLHGALSEGRTWSVGLQYRLSDAVGPVWHPGLTGDGFTPNGYTLAPSHPLNGAGLAPAYQVQMSYQYSAAATFGLALGREVEAFVPSLDPGASGPRQLTFTGQHWLTPSWALSYDVLSQDAVQPLRSMGLRLGVRYRW